MIIDFHTHAFPDNVAAKAIPALEKEGDIKAKTSGTARSLLASMDRAGIDRSIICSIATRPEQFNSILDWSGQIRCERLIPLPSI
ncbi:MAG: amidohydrolase, partial [Proteobacteria bacterium]|nr:amidohydrolase [Pseudomonadota bacterium]